MKKVLLVLAALMISLVSVSGSAMNLYDQGMSGNVMLTRSVSIFTDGHGNVQIDSWGFEGNGNPETVTSYSGATRQSTGYSVVNYTVEFAPDYSYDDGIAGNDWGDGGDGGGSVRESELWF